MRPQNSRLPTAPPSWRVVLWPGLFLWYAMAACTVFLHAVSVLAPWLLAEFELSRVHIGAITTVAFTCAALISVLSGTLVDRYGTRRAMWGLFCLNGAAFVVLGLAPTAPWVYAAAVLGGVGTALGNPATNRIISTTVARIRRGLLVGVKQAGVPSSAFVAGAALPPVAIHFGWRAAALAGLAFTVAGAFGTLALRTRRTGGSSAVMARQDEEIAKPTAHGTRRPVVMLSLYVFLVGSGVSAVQTYIVLYGVEDVGLTGTAAGWGAATVGVLGILSRVVAAPLAQRFRLPRIPLLLVAIGSLTSVVLLALAHAVPILFYVGAAGVGLTAFAGNSVAHLAVVTQLPDMNAGKASGAVQSGYYAGFILFPLVFGALVDLTGTYWPGWVLVAAWFVGAIVLAAAGWREPDRGGGVRIRGPDQTRRPR